MDQDLKTEPDKEKEAEEKVAPIQIGMHSISNMIGSPKQTTLFSDQEKQFSQAYKVDLEREITEFGIDLTDVQSRVMEGILRGFTEMDYKGNAESVPLAEIKEKYAGKVPDAYKYVKEIPRIRITQSQLLSWCGVKATNIGGIERALEALKILGTRQYCFYYERLAYDPSGTPLKDNKGNWKKEEVSAVDTLFTVKEVRDKESGFFKYYEIVPSSIFLDQRESYFLLIPNNWREEVTQCVGKRKASSYTFKFLLFLMYQYEQRRRKKILPRPYEIRKSWEEIAIALKMPESLYKKNKKRANKMLDGVYSVAKTLGYLESYERTSAIDILRLRDEKYYSPSDRILDTSKATDAVAKISQASRPISKAAEYLLRHFHSVRTKIDPVHRAPTGEQHQHELRVFDNLIVQREKEDVERLISWGLHETFWCSMLSTPEKLVENFGEAWLAMNATRKKSKEARSIDNRELANKFKIQIKQYLPHVEVSVEAKYIEIRPDKSSTHVEYIEYTNPVFREELELVCAKLKVPIEVG